MGLNSTQNILTSNIIYEFSRKIKSLKNTNMVTINYFDILKSLTQISVILNHTHMFHIQSLVIWQDIKTDVRRGSLIIQCFSWGLVDYA